MIQRVKQFYMAITCKITDEDKKFIEAYLNKNEQELFYRLSVSEQSHCVRVAKDIKNYIYNKTNDLKYNLTKEELIKVALLHDIGKTNCNLNVFEKSIMVLLNKFTKGKLKNLII